MLEGHAKGHAKCEKTPAAYSDACAPHRPAMTSEIAAAICGIVPCNGSPLWARIADPGPYQPRASPDAEPPTAGLDSEP